MNIATNSASEAEDITNLMIFIKCYHRSVPSGHGVVFREENMRSGSAASLTLIVEPCARMYTEDHFARAIENAI